MARVVYSMMVSVDGFVETTDHSLDWVIVEEELHRFANEQEAAVGSQVYGAGMWAVMEPYWSIADRLPETPPWEVEFAKIWQVHPKVVVSRSVEAVHAPNTRLVRGDAVEEIRRLAAEPGDDIAVGGATVAASLLRADLVDEIRMFVHPAAIGAGTPFVPPGWRRELTLVDERSFATGVRYAAYRIKRGEP
ncbi:MAG TPA: dihydrofolate reductase family protein [Candidatus Limnocylindrales bacterium]|jgi:dihydrofolate reductase|nr:dihydrofolate reductase family protein [Candidatus Limnocylindrales bacterium]